MYSQKIQRFLFALTFIIPAITAGLWLVVDLLLEHNGLISENVSLILEFSIVAVTMIAEYYVISQHNEYKIRKELNDLRSQAQMVEDYYSDLELKMDGIDKLRHEIRNYLSIAAPESEIGKSLSELSDKIDFEVGSARKAKYCSNKLLNIIISKKAEEALRYNTEFKCSISVSEDIPINSFDLCSCFFNLLDNAIKANNEQIANKNKWISLNASVRGNFLIIKQSNSAYGKVITDGNGRFLTSRLDKEGHGYGLSIIKDICKKYDGYCEFELKDNVFCSIVGINLNTTK